MKTYDELVQEYREITHFHGDKEHPYKSHQQLRLPQPPLTKAKMSDKQIKLPMDFKELEINNDIISLIYNRISRRVYAGKPMNLLQLSFLLWATQGIKSIRGNNYATLRTVPCGGARHPFETYLIVRDVEGLEPGVYHYLPMTNEIEFLKTLDDMEQKITDSVVGQRWAAKANVVFYWSMVPYRSEWRYGPGSPVHALVDVGHVGQNLYMGCEALGLGTCGIGAFNLNLCGEIFDLNIDDEYICYCSPVGTVNEEDKAKEEDIYAFVKNEPGAQSN